MAAIVATLLYWPLVIVVALVLRFSGIPPERIATFDGTFNLFVGLVAWWLLAFGGACLYAATVFPWEDEAPTWRSGKSPGA